VSDSDASTILVVDDDKINRKKLKLAVEALGYVAEVAEDGEAALSLLRQQQFDLIILDLLMPMMDGFDVLAIAKQDERLREIPVVVVSGLEGDADSVSRAISLGAEDFLPKSFDPTILKARLEASLRKKRFRDKELQYFRRIDTLTNAAGQIESGEFDVANIAALDKETLKADSIGRLATVFRGMAKEIHARELRLLERIRFLQCSVILFIAATTSAITPSLSRMASSMGSTPTGMAVWVFLLASGLCLGTALFLGKFKRLSRSELAFFAMWGFLVGALQQVGVYIFSAHVEATYLTLIMALQGLFVFVIAAFIGNEKPEKKRVFGLLLGFLGIAIALFARLESGTDVALFWLLGAFIIPCIYAVETIALASKRPTRIEPIVAVGLMFGFAALFVMPMAFFSGQWMPFESLIAPLGVVILLLGLASLSANVALVYVIDLGGAVFSSQIAYGRVIAGIFWGMLLLDERLNWAAWVAIVLVLIGMYMVEIKTFDKPVKIKRQYSITN